jgi:hypothetical protein
LPRVNVVLAIAAFFAVDGAADRMAVRRALCRRIVADILQVVVVVVVARKVALHTRNTMLLGARDGGPGGVARGT